jgi:hypothetical protein
MDVSPLFQLIDQVGGGGPPNSGDYGDYGDYGNSGDDLCV